MKGGGGGGRRSVAGQSDIKHRATFFPPPPPLSLNHPIDFSSPMKIPLLLTIIILRFSSSILGSNQQNNTTNNGTKRVPGCLDIETFQTTSFLDSFNTNQLANIACFCGPAGHFEGEFAASSSVSITCIYGSTTSDLHRSIELAIKADKKIERIIVDHMDFSDKNFPVNSELPLPHLRHLEIKKCRGILILNMENNMEKNYSSSPNLDSLESVDIQDCDLREIPALLFKRTPNLKRLSLANNKIIKLKGTDFDDIKQIEALNLANNLLSSNVERDSISKLKELRSLEIGEHNYASETLLQEIGRLEKLENLDMSQMDGLSSIEQLGHFQIMSLMERLTLSGSNLKVLNSSSFIQFPSLKWLDLRVNLIEQMESDCLEGLKNLQFLTLAGNFIREIPNEMWIHLPELENVDLGWNDFGKMTKNSFAGMSGKMKWLNLRSNEALKEIEIGTFDGLANLQYLNLSNTMLGSIPSLMFNLPTLKELDLSSCHLKSIGENAFTSANNSLELLNLAMNELNTLDSNLFGEMGALKVLDISENKWLCDEKMQKIAKTIDKLYKDAAARKREFTLRFSERTVCDRPFARRGESIFELLNISPERLKYDEENDKEPTTTTTTITEAESENSTTIDWKMITLLVGGRGDEHLNFTGIDEEGQQNEDAKRPKYDINTVKYGQRAVVKKEVNTWLSGVVLTLLVIASAFCIIMVTRRKKGDRIRKQRKEVIRRRDEAPSKQQQSPQIGIQLEQTSLGTQKEKMTTKCCETDTSL